MHLFLLSFKLICLKLIISITDWINIEYHLSAHRTDPLWHTDGSYFCLWLELLMSPYIIKSKTWGKRKSAGVFLPYSTVHWMDSHTHTVSFTYHTLTYTNCMQNIIAWIIEQIRLLSLPHFTFAIHLAEIHHVWTKGK
jgi:hypothetical protein